MPSVFGAGQVDISYAALATAHVRLAPWLAVMGSSEAEGLALAGLSFWAGGEKVSFDLSTPLVGVTVDGGGLEGVDPFLPLALSELGLTFHLGEHHGLRLGMESLLPGVGWRGTFGPAYVEARLHALPMVAVGGIEGGVRF
jgi:hypothetical protein